MAPELILGPLLRYAGETDATVWVETDTTCEVGVLGHTARTFEIEGHHYALVRLTDLEPGKTYEYEVFLDGARWKVEHLLRVLPRLCAARIPVHARRRRAQRGLRARCSPGSGPAHDARAPREVARRTATVGRSDLRRRGLRGRP